jgi:hypothetical protein
MPAHSGKEVLMVRTFLFVAAAAFALGVAAPASAAPAGKVREACKADVEKFCKDIKPGGGRIIACLKGHEAEVSAGCKAAFGEVAEKIRKFAEDCKADREKFCAKVRPGRGRILACLKGRQADLAPACKAWFDKGEAEDEGE